MTEDRDYKQGGAMEPLTREELQRIIRMAKAYAKGAGGTEQWSRAWWALADAADRLDAMIARTEIKTCSEG